MRNPRIMEHRWGLRHEVSCPVHIRTRGGLMAQGRICNVSISGALVVTPLPVSLLSYVEILLVPDNPRRGIGAAIEAQVVRRTDAGFGLEWCELAPEAIRSLAAFGAIDLVEESEIFGVPSRGRR